jgi:membrane-bound lytic murein transglycosylase MltF
VLNSPLGFIDPLGLKPLSYPDIKKLVAENNRSGVADEVIIAQSWKESSFDPDATNPDSSARGLLQVTKGAAKDVGANHDDLFDPALNINAGTDYLQNRLDLVRKRRQDLTGEESRIRRALELYKSGGPEGAGYGDNILAAAECLKGRKNNPQKCLQRIHK